MLCVTISFLIVRNPLIHIYIYNDFICKTQIPRRKIVIKIPIKIKNTY